MNRVHERVPDGTGLSSATEPASSLGPTGFDPSRAQWLSELRQQLEGRGSVMVCCHPDVEIDGLPIGHSDRQCVLDVGRPKDCDVALHDGLNSREQCTFWCARKLVEPRPLSIEQAIQLVEFASAMSAGTAETAQQAQGEARQRDPKGDAQPPAPIPNPGAEA